MYAETGHYPLISSIRARQYKFWTGLCKDRLDNPESPLSIFIGHALHQNISFITHYRKLHLDYSSPKHILTLPSSFDYTTVSTRVKPLTPRVNLEHTLGLTPLLGFAVCTRWHRTAKRNEYCSLSIEREVTASESNPVDGLASHARHVSATVAHMYRR